MAFHYSPKIITNGLVTYLDAANIKSYVSGSTTWTDLTRSNNNGTLINGTTFNSSNLGSMVFDGINDYVSVVGSVITNSFTINIWVNPTAVALSGITQYAGLVNRFNGCSSGSQQRNRFLLPGTNFNFLYFQAIAAGVNYDIFSDTFSSILNQKSMCSVTFDGNFFRMYLNGVSVLSTPFALTGPLDSGTATSTLGWGAASADYYLNGKIYNYQVYNIALTPQQILQNYNALKGRYT